MYRIPRLEARFHPREFELPVIDADVIDSAEAELRKGALADPEGCRGYFPALGGRPGIDTDLPANQLLAERWQHVDIRDRRLSFNFTRLAIRRLPDSTDFRFHLDSNAATALDGRAKELPPKLVWRLLVNLSTTTPRTLEYADVNPNDVPLKRWGNYLHTHVDLSHQTQRLEIPPRNKRVAHAVLFCSSRVFHSGRDDDRGHFIGAFGCEEDA